jgi:hypothetical protein
MYQNKITYFMASYILIFMFLKMINIGNNKNECNKTSLLIASIVGLMMTTNSDSNIGFLGPRISTEYYV